jgi:type I restriction enzyme R subunit
LHGNAAATVLFNNLDSIPATTFKYPTDEEARAALALKIDLEVRERAPAGWKGDETRERTVQNALYRMLDKDRDATAALFDIIKNQPGY